MNPLLLCDFYKIGHRDQYPKGITQVWSNWTPRTSRVPGATHVIHFGLNYFIKRYLIAEFAVEFFCRPKEMVVASYREVIQATLGAENPKTDHIEQLHDLGYLPIKIYALPEGASVPLNVPALVITNTHPDFFWLPNYFETLMSAILWKPSTAATTARRYREVFLKHARRSGETDFSFVDWQGHDFSMRGMSGLEDAMTNGMGHLLSFSGTDTIPAILAANTYYSANLSVGGSVPATEHSVMSAGTHDGEFETFNRLITEIYPRGIVSIVSDTWDLWKVLLDYVPRLRDTILERDGKVVIRPDSGDPVKIICGDKDSCDAGPYFGVLHLLGVALGIQSGRTGLPLIDHAAAIYGDSITVERADEILTRCIDELKLSPYNMVFGIGSYTYQYVTRDTYGWAMKATAVRKNGEIIPIFKKPVTDNGGKFSHKGIPAVYQDDGSYGYYVLENSMEGDLDNCAFRVVFEDGNLRIDPKFDEIRARVRQGL